MRKRALLLCMLVMLFAATGVASAGQLEPGTFTITGYTTDYQLEPRPNGRTWFHLKARGGGDDAAYDSKCQTYAALSGYTVETCEEFCMIPAGKACGVEGYFGDTGEFTFEEWGVVDLDMTTQPPTGSGKGANTGIVKITTPDGRVRVGFIGATDSITVRGKFVVEQRECAGHFARLTGFGDYTGNAGFAFTVTFTGRFEH
jgi:hypothetical protein